MSALLLWPRPPRYGVYELDFAARFCLTRTERITGLKAILYDPDTPLSEYLPVKHNPTKPALIVTDPLTLISSHATRVLAEATSDQSAVGPVFNESENPEQRALLSAPYLDLSTFEEVASAVERSGSTITARNLDPACFCCSTSLITSLSEMKAREIPQAAPTKIIHTGALVHKFKGVFSSEREDLVELIPQNACTVLDVGCAQGGFGKNLKRKLHSVLLDGVEMSPKLAKEAKAIYRKIYIGRFEEVEITERYDVVHMGDVLEHLYDPWEALNKVRMLLNPGGYFTGSVPNISHWSIVRQLLSGEFEYIPVGLLCVSHIRFFTPSSLKRLLEECGFKTEFLTFQKPPPTPEGEAFIKKVVSMEISNEEILTTAEILFRARKI